jgi:IS5 family transposase
MTGDFFRTRLDALIDLRHLLAVLATPTMHRSSREGVTREAIDLFGATPKLAGA